MRLETFFSTVCLGLPVILLRNALLFPPPQNFLAQTAARGGRSFLHNVHIYMWPPSKTNSTAIDHCQITFGLVAYIFVEMLNKLSVLDIVNLIKILHESDESYRYQTLIFVVHSVVIRFHWFSKLRQTSKILVNIIFACQFWTQKCISRYTSIKVHKCDYCLAIPCLLGANVIHIYYKF